jgi:hypothetical protein
MYFIAFQLFFHIFNLLHAPAIVLPFDVATHNCAMGLRSACLATLVAAASGAFEGFYCGEPTATNYVANPQPGECRAAPRSRTCVCSQMRTSLSLSALCSALGAKVLRAPARVQFREHPPPARTRVDPWQPHKPHSLTRSLAQDPQGRAKRRPSLSLAPSVLPPHPRAPPCT